MSAEMPYLTLPFPVHVIVTLHEHLDVFDVTDTVNESMLLYECTGERDMI